MDVSWPTRPTCPGCCCDGLAAGQAASEGRVSVICTGCGWIGVAEFDGATLRVG